MEFASFSPQKKVQLWSTRDKPIPGGTKVSSRKVESLLIQKFRRSELRGEESPTRGNRCQFLATRTHYHKPHDKPRNCQFLMGQHDYNMIKPQFVMVKIAIFNGEMAGKPSKNKWMWVKMEDLGDHKC